MWLQMKGITANDVPQIFVHPSHITYLVSGKIKWNTRFTWTVDVGCGDTKTDPAVSPRTTWRTERTAITGHDWFRVSLPYCLIWIKIIENKFKWRPKWPDTHRGVVYSWKADRRRSWNFYEWLEHNMHHLTGYCGNNRANLLLRTQIFLSSAAIADKSHKC